MPREIIPGNDNGPYAQRTELGWGIIGNVTKSMRGQNEEQEGAEHVTYRVTSRSATNSTLSQQKICYFWTKTSAKEIINPDVSKTDDGIRLFRKTFYRTADVTRRQKIYAQNGTRNMTRRGGYSEETDAI